MEDNKREVGIQTDDVEPISCEFCNETFCFKNSLQSSTTQEYCEAAESKIEGMKHKSSQTPFRMLIGQAPVTDSESYRPVTRSQTFCDCLLKGIEKKCMCGEDDKVSQLKWVWDSSKSTYGIAVEEKGCLASFHKEFSTGCAVVRGNLPMQEGQHFWEIKMKTPVYGTDMMVGIGTENVDMQKYKTCFCSFLGLDKDSWGLSYDGRVQHDSRKTEFCSRFGQGTIIGVHLDMWHGRLNFYKNRKDLGTAYTGLRGKTLYPMACSTAARSRMKLVRARSFPTSLEFMCCQTLRKYLPPKASILDSYELPPGLREFLQNNVPWLVSIPYSSNWECEDVCSFCASRSKMLNSNQMNRLSDDEMPPCDCMNRPLRHCERNIYNRYRSSLGAGIVTINHSLIENDIQQEETQNGQSSSDLENDANRKRRKL